MIDSFNEYINQYIINFPHGILPGEHHFVAMYLVPKIYKLTGVIPDYINPDGTKMLPGDIIYKRNNISIEVKYNKIIFTKSQYNNWIVKQDQKVPDSLPNYFIGIDKNGLLIQKWSDFAENYKNILNKNGLITKRSSPAMMINNYLKHCKQDLNNEFFANAKKNECLFEKKIQEIFNK